MSEPDGAFLRLVIDRDALVRWLDAEVPPPTRWHDWGEIGGSWYLGDGPKPLSETPAELAEAVAEAAAALAGTTNRAMLLDMFRPDDPYADESRNTRHFSYDPATRAFTAGAVLFSENLSSLLLFLAVARGAADALGPGDSGVAAVHGWAFDSITQAAVRLGPGGASRFLTESEQGDAVAVFQPVADRIIAGQQGENGPTPSEPIDELNALR